jgi:hypothetical protein
MPTNAALQLLCVYIYIAGVWNVLNHLLLPPVAHAWEWRTQQILYDTYPAMCDICFNCYIKGEPPFTMLIH